jgi:hypothetical protein
VRGALGDHRWRLVLISAVAMVALVALAAAAVVTQRGDPGASTKEPQAKGPQTKEPQTKEPPASLGIDLVHCPKAEPEKLPPYALADATEAALDQVPSVFGDVEANEGAYAVAAYLGESGLGRSPMITKGLGCSKLLQDRSVTVDLIFPKMLPSASLSQHTVFVARFRGDYWVWGVGH